MYHNLQIHKNFIVGEILISPHKDVYLIEVYQLTTYEVVIQGIDSLLWQSAMNPKWIPCITTILGTSCCTTRYCAYGTLNVFKEDIHGRKHTNVQSWAFDGKVSLSTLC